MGLGLGLGFGCGLLLGFGLGLIRVREGYVLGDYRGLRFCGLDMALH